jgi:hypothetical protein
MTNSATGGPFVVYGQLPKVAGTTIPTEYNEDAAPSLFYAGSGTLDQRYGWLSESTQANALGFIGSTDITTVLATPATASTTILAASQTITASTAMTLATQSATGIVVLSSTTQVLPSYTNIPANTIALDSLPGTIVFATSPAYIGGSTIGSGVQIYDPTKALARNVRLQVNNADTGTYKVSGYDIYGYPMTESISGTTSTTGGILSGKKAFKFVSSIVPTGTITSTTASAGTGDVFGFPIRSDAFFEAYIVVGSTTITSLTGFTAAVTTNPATSTTGDVRGTYALQTASNGSNLFAISQSPRPNNMTTTSGLFGVTQA